MTNALPAGNYHWAKPELFVPECYCVRSDLLGNDRVTKSLWECLIWKVAGQSQDLQILWFKTLWIWLKNMNHPIAWLVGWRTWIMSLKSKNPLVGTHQNGFVCFFPRFVVASSFRRFLLVLSSIRKQSTHKVSLESGDKKQGFWGSIVIIRES